MTETFPTHHAASRGLHVERLYTRAGEHPYDTVTWGRRDVVVIDDETGEPTFEQLDVEFPDTWGADAATIVATQFFHGELDEPGCENSLRHVIDRVVWAYTAAGRREGYFASEADAEVFGAELGFMLLHQVFAFDGPVWSTVGTVDPQRVSDSFILSVHDSLDSIRAWHAQENALVARGSRVGVDISHLRSTREVHGPSGEPAPGPVSFMRGANASSGLPRGSRSSRRVVLDIDHPDVAEFVGSAAKSQAMVGLLRDAGYSPERDLLGAEHRAGSTVRITDEFMNAVDEQDEFDLRARTTGEVVDQVDAADLWSDLAHAVWSCGEPVIQLDDTVNDWHTAPEAGRVSASDPASGYLHLDDSTVALGCLNLLKFGTDDGGFDVTTFVGAVELAVTALDLGLSMNEAPTAAIDRTTRSFRQVGLGHANLSALLTAVGLAYDSDEARAMAGAVTALMTATASRRSAELAEAVAPYPGIDTAHHERVVRRHQDATDDLTTTRLTDLAIRREATKQWAESLRLGASYGWRNAHLTALSPAKRAVATMGCATQGVEPYRELVRTAELASGAVVDLVEPTVGVALQRLGYDGDVIGDVLEHLAERAPVDEAPGLRPEHHDVLATSDDFSVPPAAVQQMAAACQPFVSGAVALTVRVPADASVGDVQELLHDGWRLGLKTVAVHRDGSEVAAPPAAAEPEIAETPLPTVQAEQVRTVVVEKPVRRRLPRTRTSSTTAFTVAGTEGHLTSSTHEDGSLGEIFLGVGKHGSSLAGLTEALGIAVSIGLEHGVPLETFVSKFADTRFDPAGLTDDPDVRQAHSLLDYVFRRLALDHLDLYTRTNLGVHTAEERQRFQETGEYGDPDALEDHDGDVPLSMPVIGSDS